MIEESIMRRVVPFLAQGRSNNDSVRAAAMRSRVKLVSTFPNRKRQFFTGGGKKLPLCANFAPFEEGLEPNRVKKKAVFAPRGKKLPSLMGKC